MQKWAKNCGESAAPGPFHYELLQEMKDRIQRLRKQGIEAID